MSSALASALLPSADQRGARVHIREVGQVAAAVVPAALLTVFALIPQPPYGARPFEDAWRRHLIVAAALLVWWIALLLRRRLPRPLPLLAPLLLFFLTQALAAAVAPDWRIGVEPVLELLAGILVFVALADVPGLSAAGLRRALELSALALAVACLFFVWNRWFDWLTLTQSVPDAGASLLPPTVPRVLGVGTNPNIVAPLMTLTAPLYLLSLLESRGWRRAGFALAALVVQAGVFFTLSRSAWGGELVGLAVAGVLLSLTAAHARPRLKRWAGAAAVGLVLAACAVTLTLSLGWRPLWLFRPTISARSDFRVAGIEIIRAHPILGDGPASFSLDYPTVSSGDPAGAVHSHNVPIEIAVESGLLGLIAASLVAAAAATMLWRLWKHGDRRTRSIVACVAGALAGFGATGMGDALQLFPEILFMLGALMAMAIRAGAADQGMIRPIMRRVGWMQAVAVMALATTLLAAWIRIDQGDGHYGRSIELAAKQRWLAAAAEAERAIALDRAMPAYYVQEALSLEMAQNAHVSTDGRQRAIALLRRALELEPRSPVTRLDLAMLLQEDGEREQALALVPSMVEGAPRDSLVLLAAGVMEEGSRPEQAIDAYASALAESPRIADSPFWRETAFRRQHYDEIVQKAFLRAGNETSSSGPASVREIIEQASGQTRAAARSTDYLGRVDLAREMTANGDYTGALSILVPAAARRPDDPSARLALGELYSAEGDVRAAHREWLAGAYLGDAGSIMHLGDTVTGGGVPPRIIELGRWALTDLWGRQFGIEVQHYRFAYRRQEPLPIVLPGDWLNALPAIYTRMKASVESWEAANNWGRH